VTISDYKKFLTGSFFSDSLYFGDLLPFEGLPEAPFFFSFLIADLFGLS